MKNLKDGNIKELQKELKDPKGEYVIIIEKNKKTEKQVQQETLNTLSIEEHYTHYEEKGLDKKEIIKQIAKDRKLNKNEVYQKFLYR